MSGACPARNAVFKPAYSAVFSYQVCLSLMPGFLASNSLIASSTNVRFGISAAQWLQKVNSLTCWALEIPDQVTVKSAAVMAVERHFLRMGILRRCRDGRRRTWLTGRGFLSAAALCSEARGQLIARQTGLLILTPMAACAHGGAHCGNCSTQ